MKKISLIFSFIAVFAFGAIAQHDHHQHSQHNPGMEMKQSQTGKADPVFQKQLAAVYESNLQLKDALVASDKDKASEAAKKTADALKKVDMKLLKGQAHMDWMTQLKTLNSGVSTIAEAASLDAQRKAFANFSQALYKSVKQFGIGGQEAYYQYCPMALNNQGAYWLSAQKEIRNPYFGAGMLKCGTTKEVVN